ncbi:MAG: hypothetical protein SGJ24_02790 [Chloroflexota bacterium]|nr:hypothetical protein [Chloroflexota bacterium]
MRFLVSLAIALAIGIGVGLYLGLVQFPVEYTDAAMPRLSARHQDDYTVMIAYGFQADGDPGAALERLRPLEFDNVPQHIQETAERYISSSRGVGDVRALVTLAEGVGRLTPIMEPYRQVEAGG